MNEAGHFPFREQPAHFERIVAAFMAGIAAAPHRVTRAHRTCNCVSGGWPSIIRHLRLRPDCQCGKSQGRSGGARYQVRFSCLVHDGWTRDFPRRAVRRCERSGDGGGHQSVRRSQCPRHERDRFHCWPTSFAGVADSVGTLLFGRLLDGSACICFGVGRLLLADAHHLRQRRTGALTLWADQHSSGISRRPHRGCDRCRDSFVALRILGRRCVLLAAAILSRAFRAAA